MRRQNKLSDFIKIFNEIQQQECDLNLFFLTFNPNVIYFQWGEKFS